MNNNKAAKERKKTAKEAGKPLLKQARAVSKSMPTRGLSQQMSALMSPLTRQEEATLEYAHTLANPWIEQPGGCPLVLGSGTVRTNKAQLIFEGQAQANEEGFAFVAVQMDGWTPIFTGTDQQNEQTYHYTTAQGTPVGWPIWYSNHGYAGGTGGTPTSLPADSDDNTILGLVPVATKILDGTVNSSTMIRQVACGLRVFSDAPAISAQGKLCIVATSDPTANAATGGLSLATYEGLSGMPQDLVSFQTRPCAGWKSGEALHAVAIPNNPLCFQLNDANVTPGWRAFVDPQLAAILTGGEPYQTFTWQVVYDYEFSFSMTNITGVADDPIYNAGTGAVGNIVAGMTQQGATRPGHLALTNGKNPLGAKAWLSHIHATQPGRAPAILQMASKPSPTGGGWFNNLGKALKPAAQAGLGLLSSIPGVGGVLGKLGSGILSMFG